jgi:hypothetical protein
MTRVNIELVIVESDLRLTLGEQEVAELIALDKHGGIRQIRRVRWNAGLVDDLQPVVHAVVALFLLHDEEKFCSMRGESSASVNA